MKRTNFDNFRFYHYPSNAEMQERLTEDQKWVYTCDKCQWTGVEVNAAVDDGETHLQYLCPQCGLVLGGVVESLDAFYKDKPRMEHVLDNLDRIANLIQQDIPIVFLPIWADADKDPLKGKCAMVLRKPEFKEELEKLSEVGRISMAEGQTNDEI